MRRPYPYPIWTHPKTHPVGSRVPIKLDGANCIREEWPMIVRKLADQTPFTTTDGSTIRSILDLSNAPVEQQSLAEARLPAGADTQRHYHRLSEEFYFILEGHARMEIDGETTEIGRGDAVLIPAGARHQIRAGSSLRFLCCCAPPWSSEDTFFD